MPDSEPPTEAAEPRTVEQQGDRTHPLTGLVQGVLWAGVAMAAVLGQLFTGGNGEDGLPLWLDVLMRVGGGLVLGIGFGYLTWWFTRYLIDGTELRITSGILQKSSRRIPYERIQSVDIAEPFLARIIGLAELRIEMAGGKDSRTTLRFLPLDDARRLRRLLLGRAHGRAADETGGRHRRAGARGHRPRVSRSRRAGHGAFTGLPRRRARHRRRPRGGDLVRPGARVPRRHHPAVHVARTDRRQAHLDAVGLHAHPERPPGSASSAGCSRARRRASRSRGCKA